MTGLARLYALSWRERLLLAEATTALGVAALAVAFVPFRHIAAHAARRSAGRAASPATIAEIRWAIGACARRAAWRAGCFEQGLAAHWMLRRRAVAASLHYGVTTAPGDALAAHVWVRSGAIAVIGCESSGDFRELDCFGSLETH